MSSLFPDHGPRKSTDDFGYYSGMDWNGRPWESKPDDPPKDQINVGDLNSKEKGSGARKSKGKVAFSLVPLHLLAGCARVLMYGRTKYAPWNWAKGMVWSECLNCTLRHLFRWWFLGEDYDDETGEHHLDHVLCNVLFLKHYTLSYKEGDDRPPPEAMFGPEEFKDFMKLFED